METRSRARMFYGTARALNSVAERRQEGALATIAEHMVDEAPIPQGGYTDDDLAGELVGTLELPYIQLAHAEPDAQTLARLHSEYRWAESKLMRSSEALAEAQQARRKDLVALACMRRDLRASFAAERAYVEAQLALLRERLPALWSRERSLSDIAEDGVATARIVHELATIRAERKIHELAAAQAAAQLSRIDDDVATLEHAVAQESLDAHTARRAAEIGRLDAARERTRKVAARMRREAGALIADLRIDTTHGEIAAAASFLAAEVEGDARAAQRMQRIRAAQIRRELAALPEPATMLKAVVRPRGWLRARRVSTS